MRVAVIKNVIAGTAGHIDHGKTALVRALTGIETDRLKEEKERGISIELGFAHLDLSPNLRVGFVDVPGHERFIKNMLAGVGGIDFVLFVIASDESIKPQTREHFDICRLLAIPRGIVVLTKADLVDRDILELVRLEVDDFVKGSFLEQAPVIAVSSVTGEGLEELRAEIHKLALAVQEKDATQHFRLPVDRAFTMRGFGTVVTGTLVSGGVKPEQDVELFPGGRRLRVRGVQVHGKSVARASAGQRTALNLAGVETSELRRGMMLAEAGQLKETVQIDCGFELLATAKPLKHRAPVHFHAGSAEVEAEVRLLDRSEAMKPGSAGYVRLRLREPLQLLPGDRFIVRMFSPVSTIGGGTVLDIAAPRRGTIERLKTLESSDLSEQMALLVRESKHGLSLRELVARTGGRENALMKAAGKLISAESWFFDPEWINQRIEAVQTLLKQYHRANPLLPGLSKEAVRSRIFPNAPPFLLDVLLARAKTVVASGDLLHLASHKVAFQRDEEEAAKRIEQAFESAGLNVPGVAEVLGRSGVEAARARTILQLLMREKKLVRISDDLVFHPSALEALRGLLAQRKGVRFSVPEFKDWTGVSRKYAIPLLEFLDRERITRRDGDERVVMGGAA
jgi:selenocysteine-specific elongation factor